MDSEWQNSSLVQASQSPGRDSSATIRPPQCTGADYEAQVYLSKKNISSLAYYYYWGINALTVLGVNFS